MQSVDTSLIGRDELILVTGATGFLGPAVVHALFARGFRRVRCLVRPTSNVARLGAADRAGLDARLELMTGNLLSRTDCDAATKDAAVILHLAAARGEKSIPDAFMNSVVTTRNLLDAALTHSCLKRFVNVSSMTVYANAERRRRAPLTESCLVEPHPELRGDAYSFAKTKQDEIVTEYGRAYGIPYVILRPGYVYGRGNEAITGRVGLGSFGIFLHLGGSNVIPFTYVDNCARAIVLAGVTKGIDGEVFNIVDDDLPSSRQFLRLYKRHVRRFASVYMPRLVSYAACAAWEKYSDWSKGQLPPVFNRRTWRAYWRKTRYTNDKAKRLLGWTPEVSTTDGLRRYFESCREKLQRA